MSQEPREVCPTLISPLLARQPGEAAPEEVLCRPPREAWPLARVLSALLMKMGRTGLLAQPRRGPQVGKSRDPHSQNTNNDQGRACSVLISPLVLRGQAQARSTEASGKGFPIGVTRPRSVERQDGGYRGAQDSVITSAFGSRRTPLVGIACTSSPLSKWPLLAPFPLNIWEEDQGLYK